MKNIKIDTSCFVMYLDIRQKFSGIWSDLACDATHIDFTHPQAIREQNISHNSPAGGHKNTQHNTTQQNTKQNRPSAKQEAEQQRKPSLRMAKFFEL